MNINWKSLVKNVAPVLGTALGGPMAGTAVRYLAESLLNDPNATERQVADYISNASPGDLLKIKQLDNEFAVKMEELGVDVYRLDVQDRASARNLAEKKGFMPQAILSGIFVAAFAAVLISVFDGAFNMNDTQERIVMYLLGILSACLVQIMNFWFGSSSGSKEKTQILGVKQ